MTKPTDNEAVLYAFAMEPNHDRETLLRYLADHPQLTDELLDLAVELRVSPSPEQLRSELIDDPALDSAWKEFRERARQTVAVAEALNPFANYKREAFVNLAETLKMPRSLLTALRDGLVEPSSVPNRFARRFAAATGTAADTLHSYLVQNQGPAAALAFKSDENPAHQGRRTFRELIQNTKMSDEWRQLLLQECDEHERH